eukprot:COSAG06_NODE_576_length_14051_cov_5.354644_1_plen_291_part_10
MVLQREPQTASIWGFSAPGASVALKAGVASATATASPGGIWRASLPAQPASSTPVTLTATSGGATISIKDVLFGDVWVCSGQVGLIFCLLRVRSVSLDSTKLQACTMQSNMAFAAGVPTNDESAEAKIVAAYKSDPGASINGTYMSATQGVAAAANYPDIRLMTTGNVHDCKEPIIDFYPSGAVTFAVLAPFLHVNVKCDHLPRQARDKKIKRGVSAGTNDSTHPLAHPWAVASPATVGLGKDVMGGTSCKGPLCFSATCWYYGMELNEKLKVPIGLIHSSYGGSAVEDWI